jgi:hypothetical protein
MAALGRSFTYLHILSKPLQIVLPGSVLTFSESHLALCIILPCMPEGSWYLTPRLSLLNLQLQFSLSACPHTTIE